MLTVGWLSFDWLRHRTTTRPANPLRYYGIVFVPFILFVFAVMHKGAVYLLVARLYLNISFQHSRISVAAMLPVAILTGLYLAQSRGPLSRRDRYTAIAVSALVVGLSAISFSDLLDQLRAHTAIDAPLYFSCDRCPSLLPFTYLLTSDFIRLVALTIVFVVLVIAGFALGGRGQRIVATVLAVTIVFQTIWGAADYLEGPQTRDYTVPWETNDFVVARSDQFVPPTPSQLAQLHALLDNDNYRSVAVCPPIPPPCNTAVGMTWSIRLVDGYASGVPRRLALMPDVGGRPARPPLHIHHWPPLADAELPQRAAGHRHLQRAVHEQRTSAT